MANLTNTGSRNPFKLCPCAANLKYTDLLPFNEKNGNTVTKVFLRKIVEMLLDHIKKTFDRNEKILEFHQPEEMATLMDLSIPEKPMPLQQLLNDAHQTLQYHVKAGHPRFFNQLSNGLDVISLAGDWLISTCNTNTFTYEVASIFLIMEAVVFKHMRRIIGWDSGETTLAPGGSMSNLYAILLARTKLFPEYKQKGLIKGCPGQLTMYTSSASHYSMKRGAVICGLGLDNCGLVPLQEDGKMDPDELEKMIKADQALGKTPFFVNCTCGTTVLGVFDPIKEIRAICDKYNCWMHIDAAWGGGMMLSRKYRPNLFAGVETCDSITWNPHKLMNVILQCSTINVHEEGLFEECNSMKAKYLFMTDKFYDVKYDTGDKSIQCGRRNDVFKLWLLWRARGDEGYERFIDRCMELTQYLTQRIKDQSDKFILIQEPTMVNCCFWYMSRRLRNMPDSKEKKEEMGKLCPQIKGKLMTCGTAMLAYQQDDIRPNYFRNIISSTSPTEKDIDFLLCEIDRLGEDL